MCIQKTRLACIKIGDVTVKQSESPCPPGRWQGQVLTRGREEPARSLNRRKAPPPSCTRLAAGLGEAGTRVQGEGEVLDPRGLSVWPGEGGIGWEMTYLKGLKVREADWPF